MNQAIRFVLIAAGACLLALAAGCAEPTAPRTDEPSTTATPVATLPAEPATQPAKVPATQPTTRPGRYYSSASSIVYLVDRSGSMAPIFQEIQREILISLARLEPTCDFTIIYFGDNGYIQGPRRMLIGATLENKIEANRFLRDIAASGSTAALPALVRAFQVLKYGDARKRGRLVYLISDGDFAGLAGGSRYTTAGGKKLDGNEAVLQWLRDNNPKKERKGLAHINTYLFGEPEEEAVKVMKAIAAENGGCFKHVAPDE